MKKEKMKPEKGYVIVWNASGQILPVGKDTPIEVYRSKRSPQIMLRNSIPEYGYIQRVQIVED